MVGKAQECGTAAHILSTTRKQGQMLELSSLSLFVFWDANRGAVAPIDRMDLPTSIFSLSSVYVCVDQRTNCGSLFSNSTMWVLGIKLRSLGLMAGVFIC